nr:MAG TPA: hypothetical protein [Caudoviricetes sp.]
MNFMNNLLILQRFTQYLQLTIKIFIITRPQFVKNLTKFIIIIVSIC